MTLPETSSIDKAAEEISIWLNGETGRFATLSEGKRRNRKGKIIEEACEKMWKTSWHLLAMPDNRLKINNMKIPYDYIPKNKKGELLLSEIKESIQDKKLKGKKKQGKGSGIGTDLNIYVDERLVVVAEIKTYCDISMFKRAYSEFESIVAISPACPTFVLFQCENALGGDMHESEVCSDASKMSINLSAYLWNRRRLLGEKSPAFHILTARNAKRCSKKEMYMRETPFTKERIHEILKFMILILKGKIDA